MDMVSLEDVLAVLEELEHAKERVALQPNESTAIQYSNIGVAAGVKAAKIKLKNHFGREQY